MRIQIDMFAVELGLAMLLQFETEDGAVRVMFDGGELKHNVVDRLPAAMDHFTRSAKSEGTYRIDLLVGSHYDSDHLDGLVPIIRNERFEIGEAWLPPVANDTQDHTLSDPVRDSDLLALQFAGENGQKVLSRYLSAKRDECLSLKKRENAIKNSEPGIVIDEPIRTISETNITDNTASRAFFEGQLRDVMEVVSGLSPGHGDSAMQSPWEFTDRIESAASKRRGMWWPLGIVYEHDSWPFAIRRNSTIQTLALVRKAAADNAITAISLNAVVEALKSRGIRIRCPSIPNGTPRQFTWSRADRRFTPMTPPIKSALAISLLGPSTGLVEKLREKLPVSEMQFVSFVHAIPIKSITASNQLSLIGVIEYLNQRILVSGDAGCVDFKQDRKKYFPALLDRLAQLDVVQVAHHVGNNAHFYRCLLGSRFPDQKSTSYHLLSHAIHDKHRPSDEFAKYVESLVRRGAKTRLLFTSEPQEPKIRDAKHLIDAVVGAPCSQGDVRLGFDGKQWSVTKHAIRVP
jgi:hypothetical protein